MKKLVGVLVFVFALQLNAQDNSALLKHYEAYYKQMKTQGDVQGVINALTHINILAPNEARLDTLAVIYMNNGNHSQALNTIGIEKKATDSDMAVEVKALSLQALNQPARALEHYEEMYKRKPNVLVAYEMADLKIQLKDFNGASVNITYGMANAKEDMMRTYYESQRPYQVPIKAGFLYLKGLVKFQENNTENLDAAIALFDQALAVAPSFNLAKLSKDALASRKTAPKQD